MIILKKDIKQKSGYLDDNFKLFHLKDKKEIHFEYHYHDFNKIIIFLSGKVTYLIEGKAYNLKPWDILLVNSHDIHKPVIDSSETYERIVIWVNSEFIRNHNYENCDLMTCFRLADKKSFNLVRLEENLQNNLKSILNSLEKSMSSKEFASKLLSNTLFMELIIYINRIIVGNKYKTSETMLKYDNQIIAIIKYINDNLSSPSLSIKEISDKFYISRYNLMHKFKKQTGYTVHNYIIQKKLIAVKKLIQKGVPAVQASENIGFSDYSAFLRAFKKLFNASPRQFQNFSDNS